MIDVLGNGCSGTITQRSRRIRTGAHVRHILTNHCLQCGSHPCLGSQACEHEDRLRLLEHACPRGRWDEGIRWVTTDERTRAVGRLVSNLPGDVTAVAGIPRSGMSSAAQISEALHLPLYYFHRDTGLVTMPHGFRLADGRPDDGTLLVVDDTVASGLSMCSAIDAINRVRQTRRVITAAVYASPEAMCHVDVYGEILPIPHFLEWNFFNSIFVSQSAFDFDGILCEDCPPGDDDDGPRYDAFLKNAKPKYLVRNRPIPEIVTARHEKYREPTLTWMERHGVACDRLTMGQWPDNVARCKEGAAAFKGAAYARSPTTIFVESCPIQSRLIADISKKRVICPASNEVLN